MSKVQDILKAIIAVNDNKELSPALKAKARGALVRELPDEVSGILNPMEPQKTLDAVIAVESKDNVDNTLYPAFKNAVIMAEAVNDAAKAILDLGGVNAIQVTWKAGYKEPEFRLQDKNVVDNDKARFSRVDDTVRLVSPDGQYHEYQTGAEAVRALKAAEPKFKDGEQVAVNAWVSLALAYRTGKPLSGWRRVNDRKEIIWTDESPSVVKQTHKNGKYQYSGTNPLDKAATPARKRTPKASAA